MLVTVVDTLSLLFLPVCLNVVFLSLPRSLTAASFRSLCSHKRSWQNHIPSSRSFSCNRLSGNKKSRHTNAYRLPAKRIDLSLLRWRLHIHVTGFEIQSRNCPLRLSDCRQFRAIQNRRYFPLAYRRRCPAESRHPKSVKNVIQFLLRDYFIIPDRTTVCQGL